MSNKILTIAIPTYERAGRLASLLQCLEEQIGQFFEEVEVCISNNGSKDNTKQVALDFLAKHPGRARYRENNENLGGDKNFLQVMEMAQGEFIWLFGDDDLMAQGAVAEVIKFIKANKNQDIGLVFVKTETYLKEDVTQRKIILGNTVEKLKTEAYLIDKQAIVSMTFANIAFMSGLVLNKKMLFEILKEEQDSVSSAIGTFHIHMALCSLLFLRFKNAAAYALNKRALVLQELSCHKLFVEDKFLVHYWAQKALAKMLLVSKNIDKNYGQEIIKRTKTLGGGFLVDLLVMRTFGNYNYFSFFGCCKLFFKKADFFDALIFSFLFSLLFIIPPPFLRLCYAATIFLMHGKGWRKKWEISRKIALITSDSRIRVQF